MPVSVRGDDIDVTVIFAVKNEEVYIESAVRSVAAQAGVNVEIIVVDDGSDDLTFGQVKRLSAELGNVTLLRNPGRGKSAAFNHGVALARGTFVCLFAGDDIMPEGSLAERFATVADQSAAGPVVGLCKLVTLSETKKYDGHLIPRKKARGALSGVSYLMNHAAVSILFPVPDHLPNEDTWLELAVTFFPGLKVIHSDVIGCAWRVHSGNSINMLVGFDEFNERYTQRMQACKLLFDRHGPELAKQDQVRLRGLIVCEECRKAGDVFGVLCSPVGLVPKLRALSLSNKSFYWLRNKLYGLLSGW